MPTAWQVREYQRQQLIEELTRKFYQRVDEVEDKSFCFKLASVMIYHLKERQKGISSPNDIERDVAGIFFINSLAEIHKFARTKAENDVLVIGFFQKVLQTGLNSFHAELMREEINNPEKIFNAPSATSEIPIEETIP